jgi:tetratricopeptide (TPR) repeat protein
MSSAPDATNKGQSPQTESEMAATAESWASRGDSLFHLGRWAEAFEAFAAAGTENPAEFDASEWAARAYQFQQEQQLDFARKAYIHATQQTPESAEAWYNLGTFLKEQGNWEDALEAFRRASNVDRGFIAGYLEASQIYLENDDDKRALEALELAKDAQPSDALVWKYIGSVHYNRNRAVQAQQAFEQATILEPEDGEAWNMLGNSFFNQVKLDEALRSYHRALAISGEHNRFVFSDAWPHNNIAHIYLRLHRFEEAKTAIDKALEIDSKNREFWLEKILIISATGNASPQELDLLVDRSLTEVGQDPELRMTLAGCLAEYGQPDRARRLIDDIDPATLEDEDSRLGLVENFVVTHAFGKAAALLRNLDKTSVSNSRRVVLSFYSLLLEQLGEYPAGSEPFPGVIDELQQRFNETVTSGHRWGFLSIPWMFQGVRRLVMGSQLSTIEKFLFVTLVDVQEGLVDPAKLRFFAGQSIDPPS